MSWTQIIFMTLGFAAFVKLLQILYNAYIFREAIHKIPGPRLLPFIGSVFVLWELKEEDEIDWYKGLSLRYKNGLFHFLAGHVASVSVRHPRHVEAVLSSTPYNERAIVYDLLRPWLGNGLLTAKGQKWFHDRKLILPTVNFSMLEKYASFIGPKAEILVRSIEKRLEEKKPVEMTDLGLRYTLDIICEAAMGVDIHAQDGQANEYFTSLHRFTEIAFNRLRYPWLLWDWLFRLTPIGRESQANANVLHEFTRKVIKERKQRRSMTNGVTENHKDDDEYPRRTKAFLDYLLDAIDNGEVSWTDEELREQVDTFMFGGHDTTGFSIGWALFCLGNYPEHQEKVHEELQNVFGDSKEPATLKEISQLKYLDRVTKEARRLYPVVPVYCRLLEQDLQLDEYLVPKRTLIVLSPFMTHRDPETWPNAEEFDPDRFLPENSAKRHPYAYLPFSGGIRSCIGMKLAYLMEKFALCAILRKWRVKSTKTRAEMKMVTRFTMRPMDGIYIHFTPKE